MGIVPGSGSAQLRCAVVLEIPLVRLDETLPLPSYARLGDAGCDLVARHGAILSPAGGRATIATGIAARDPRWSCGSGAAAERPRRPARRHLPQCTRPDRPWLPRRGRGHTCEHRSEQPLRGPPRGPDRPVGDLSSGEGPFRGSGEPRDERTWQGRFRS